MKIFREFFADKEFNFMMIHKCALLFSVILVISSLLLIYFKGLNLGIDFSGGVLIEVRIKNSSVKDLRSVLSNKIDANIQNIGNDDYLIRVAKTDKSYDSQGLYSTSLEPNQRIAIEEIQKILSDKYNNSVIYRKIDYVGPQIGSELIQKGFMALFLSLIFLMIYIWVRFDWQFGIGGILSLLHDTILVVGFYSLTQIEFNLTSIAAILTVIGYSINDSVVIFDRIRENLRRWKKSNMNKIINSSLNSTLVRTILTSFTTLLALLALILFGGSVLSSFSVGAFFGVVVGVYSSIFIAAPLLLYCDPRGGKHEKEKF